VLVDEGVLSVADRVDTIVPELADRRVLRRLESPPDDTVPACMAAPGPAAGAPPVPWEYGWDGGTGTTWRSDPVCDLTGILLTQRAMTAPGPPPLFTGFWDAAYGALPA
jgi:CubicO group peptidase (beta-lactamase class C family)